MHTLMNNSEFFYDTSFDDYQFGFKHQYIPNIADLIQSIGTNGITFIDACDHIINADDFMPPYVQHTIDNNEIEIGDRILINNNNDFNNIYNVDRMLTETNGNTVGILQIHTQDCQLYTGMLVYVLSTNSSWCYNGNIQKWLEIKNI